MPQHQQQPRATTAIRVNWKQLEKLHTVIVLAPSTSVRYSQISARTYSCKSHLQRITPTTPTWHSKCFKKHPHEMVTGRTIPSLQEMIVDELCRQMHHPLPKHSHQNTEKWSTTPPPVCQSPYLIWVPNRTILHYLYPDCSYTILAPAIVKKESDPKKACAGVLEKIQLDAELYRLGNTKACFETTSFRFSTLDFRFSFERGFSSE